MRTLSGLVVAIVGLSCAVMLGGEAQTASAPAPTNIFEVDFSRGGLPPEYADIVEKIRKESDSTYEGGPLGFPLCEQVYKRKAEELTKIHETLLANAAPQFRPFAKLFKVAPPISLRSATEPVSLLSSRTLVYRYRRAEANKGAEALLPNNNEVGVPISEVRGTTDKGPGDFVLSSTHHLTGDSLYQFNCWDEVWGMPEPKVLQNPTDLPDQLLYSQVQRADQQPAISAQLLVVGSPKFMCRKSDGEPWQARGCAPGDEGTCLFTSTDTDGRCLFSSLFKAKGSNGKEMFYGLRTRWTGAYFISGEDQEGKPHPAKVLIQN